MSHLCGHICVKSPYLHIHLFLNYTNAWLHACQYACIHACRHACKHALTFIYSLKRNAPQHRWSEVFAKKKLECLEWELFFTRPLDPHKLNVETWALECSNNFKLFFRKLRALDVHTINIGLWGGQGDGWDLRNIVDKLFFCKHRSKKTKTSHFWCAVLFCSVLCCVVLYCIHTHLHTYTTTYIHTYIRTCAHTHRWHVFIYMLTCTKLPLQHIYT